MLEVYKSETGLYVTNSYLIFDPISGESAVIDPGVFDGEYEKFLKERGVTVPKYILLTHGHFDHICGAYPLKEKLGGEILIHEEDAICLKNADASLANAVEGYFQIEAVPDATLKDGDTLYLGENKITVMHTPGHTRGSVIFMTDEYIFSGDTLFRRGMGRTDLPGGSTKALFKSLRAIGQIQGEYKIFPGHGPLSGLSYEKRNNRYLRANDTSHE
ncbi:MAG: MBL fold metallo-hydrolase [Clostridia bacterium]|nr:MBL fold metallo-hydrolase [Clostridia bacterium]